jgi:hypothetical protein
MKLGSSARVLKGKSISSIRTSVAAFDSLNDDGRTTIVLLHLQHAFEMLLKASLNQEQVTLFDKKTGRSVGIDSVINRAQSALHPSCWLMIRPLTVIGRTNRGKAH